MWGRHGLNQLWERIYTENGFMQNCMLLYMYAVGKSCMGIDPRKMKVSVLPPPHFFLMGGWNEMNPTINLPNHFQAMKNNFNQIISSSDCVNAGTPAIVDWIRKFRMTWLIDVNVSWIWYKTKKCWENVLQ